MESSEVDVLGMMFGIGAYSAARDVGMAEKDAEAFVEHVCKEAAAKRVKWDEDEDDEDDTWWNRNKGWALPTGIGLGAYLLGANSAMEGRPDRGHWSNLGSYVWKKLTALLGFSPDPMWRATTYADPGTFMANEMRRRADHANSGVSQKLRGISSGVNVEPWEEIDPKNDPVQAEYMLEHGIADADHIGKTLNYLRGADGKASK